MILYNPIMTALVIFSVPRGLAPNWLTASSASFSAAVSTTTACLFSPFQDSGLEGSAGTACP